VTGPSDTAARPTSDAAAAADAVPAAAPAVPSAPAAAIEPKQRWRVTFARDQPPRDEVPTGREYIGRWESAVVTAGLPAVLAASGRPRIALGAPLPSGCSADGELLEFWLTEIRPAWVVREGLQPVLPAGHRLIDLENVWVGAPALAGRVAAADYEVTVGSELPEAALAAAAAGLLATDRLSRDRVKGGETRTYNLRPLIVGLHASGQTLRMRTRIHPELGTGRPDEVVAALGHMAGVTLTVERIVRRRLVLADELEV
jgi:radical SAM-linked protein